MKKVVVILIVFILSLSQFSFVESYEPELSGKFTSVTKEIIQASVPLKKSPTERTAISGYRYFDEKNNLSFFLPEEYQNKQKMNFEGSSSYTFSTEKKDTKFDFLIPTIRVLVYPKDGQSLERIFDQPAEKIHLSNETWGHVFFDYKYYTDRNDTTPMSVYMAIKEEIVYQISFLGEPRDPITEKIVVESISFEGLPKIKKKSAEKEGSEENLEILESLTQEIPKLTDIQEENFDLMHEKTPFASETTENKLEKGSQDEYQKKIKAKHIFKTIEITIGSFFKKLFQMIFAFWGSVSAS